MVWGVGLVVWGVGFEAMSLYLFNLILDGNVIIIVLLMLLTLPADTGIINVREGFDTV